MAQSDYGIVGDWAEVVPLRGKIFESFPNHTVLPVDSNVVEIALWLRSQPNRSPDPLAYPRTDGPKAEEALPEIDLVDGLDLEDLLQEVVEPVEIVDGSDLVLETGQHLGETMPADQQDVLLLGARLSYGLLLGERLFPGDHHCAYLLVGFLLELGGEALLFVRRQLYIGVDDSGEQKPLTDVEPDRAADLVAVRVRVLASYQ